jgi:putative glutamine amidotransferase
VVEAVEYPASTFALGIQWHPEELPEDFGIFRGFVEAARGKFLSRLLPATPPSSVSAESVVTSPATDAISIQPGAF